MGTVSHEAKRDQARISFHRESDAVRIFAAKEYNSTLARLFPFVLAERQPVNHLVRRLPSGFKLAHGSRAGESIFRAQLLPSRPRRQHGNAGPLCGLLLQLVRGHGVFLHVIFFVLSLPIVSFFIASFIMASFVMLYLAIASFMFPSFAIASFAIASSTRALPPASRRPMESRAVVILVMLSLLNDWKSERH